MTKAIPPRLFLLCALASIALGLAAPGPRLPASLLATAQLVGCATFTGGLLLLLTGWGRFIQRGTEIHTFRAPRELVTDGLYRYSRNPMYLGFLGMLVGLATAFGAPMPFAGPFAFFLASAAWYIPFEETACERAFGEPYRRYWTATPRWMGAPRSR